MTILSELGSLDLSAIVQGRGTITATINGADLQKLITAGIGPSTLGDLGTAPPSSRPSPRRAPPPFSSR